MPQTANRELKYDMLRFFACIWVVILHLSGSYWGVATPDSNDFLFLTIYNGLSRFAVPSFIMLSGLFLLSPAKTVTIRSTLQRVIRMLVFFYVWSAFYAFQGIIIKFISGSSITEELISTSLQRFLWGHYHMWYILMLIGFYIIVPVLRKICEDKTVLEYFLILWICSAFIIPLLSQLPFLTWLYTWFSKFNLNILIGYIGYFVLGYYINTYGFAAKLKKSIYISGAFGLFYTISATLLNCHGEDFTLESYMGPGCWNVFLYTVAVFTFFSTLKINRTSKWVNTVSPLAACSLFIYMLHPFFIEKLNLVGITVLSFSPIISVPVLKIVIVAVCCFGAAIINKLPIPLIGKLVKP